MGREVRVPITPALLDWAIAESGYGLDVLAQRLHVEEAVLRRWLSGEERPSLTEFKALAHQLRRPSATFLLPAPPQGARLQIEFRHAPGVTDRPLLPEERLKIREVSRLQRAVAWLIGEMGESGTELPKVSPLSSPEQAGRRVREILNVAVEHQLDWKSESEALRSWREAFERIGVLVFLLPMGDEAARGFSLWNSHAPAVVVNTHWNSAARVFTLFHELGHLLTRTNSVCAEDGSATARRSDGTDVERWCERLAAAALMPEDSVRVVVSELAGSSTRIGLPLVKRIATRFRVSLRAAALRLINMQLAGWDLYKSIPPTSDSKRGGGGGKGRTRPQKRLDEYGRRTTQVFVRAMRRDVISASDAMRYLDVGDQNLVELEQLVS